MDLCLQFLGVKFQVNDFFDLEQLASPDHHLAYFKGVAIFLKVAIPYSMVTITNPFQLGLQPEANPKGCWKRPYSLPELLVGRIDGCLLGIWTCEAVPGC